jgi:tetratricopeptide (TPR) repeat protein
MNDTVHTCSDETAAGAAMARGSTLSQSPIWDMQRSYFAERGVEAWRQGEVPHYVTSNPTIANAYAELVLAFRRDRGRLAPDEPADEPQTICELGAGSGRFAFHFLSRLADLCAQADVPLSSFRYVLTDVAQSNLDFWRGHPRFQPLFENGVLDMARFDVARPSALALQVSGKTIGAGALRRPLIVLANYLFDSVPQDLFHFHDGRAHRCLVSLGLKDDPASLGAAELLAQVQVAYDDEEIAGAAYDEPALQALIIAYQRQLHDSHVLFPAAGLRSLQHLAALSPHGLLLLTADKGDHRLAALEGRPAPQPVRHGSISLSVNYHAFASFCAGAGGLALVPADHHSSINVIALMMLADAARHADVQKAYRRHVQEFGPDSFYAITRHARETIPQMSADDILAYLRLSRHDSHQFGRYLPRLLELAPEFDAATREDVIAAIERVWELYFPLGEDLDLANRIAALLYAMNDYPRALDYFERSMEIYGPDSGTLYNIACCYQLLGEDAVAAAVLGKVLEHDPENEPAKTLLAHCEGAEAEPAYASSRG